MPSNAVCVSDLKKIMNVDRSDNVECTEPCSVTLPHRHTPSHWCIGNMMAICWAMPSFKTHTYAMIIEISGNLFKNAKKQT